MMKKKMKKDERNWDTIVTMFEVGHTREMIIQYLETTECVFCKKLFPLDETITNICNCHNGKGEICPISKVGHCDHRGSHWEVVSEWVYWKKEKEKDVCKWTRKVAEAHAIAIRDIIKEWKES